MAETRERNDCATCTLLYSWMSAWTGCNVSCICLDIILVWLVPCMSCPVVTSSGTDRRNFAFFLVFVFWLAVFHAFFFLACFSVAFFSVLY